jgi:hypothetical protein
MIHVFTFVKGDETLSMAYTTEGVMTGDTMAPIEDGWDYDSITDIPMLDESYDSIKTLWAKGTMPAKAGVAYKGLLDCEFDDYEKSLDVCDCGVEGGC